MLLPQRPGVDDEERGAWNHLMRSGPRGPVQRAWALESNGKGNFWIPWHSNYLELYHTRTTSIMQSNDRNIDLAEEQALAGESGNSIKIS